MRALILAAGLLALAACRNNDQVDNTQNVDYTLSLHDALPIDRKSVV